MRTSTNVAALIKACKELIALSPTPWPKYDLRYKPYKAMRVALRRLEAPSASRR